MSLDTTTTAPNITTLGDLKASGYAPRSIKEELRANLISRLQSGDPTFPSIVGYENTVLPEVERAILAGHSILLLGLRGQAKTKIARLMVHLLDEWVPYVSDSELHEDPMAPLLSGTQQLIDIKGDSTPISWLHRSQRYFEKLATPDVSVADLVGDIDPIKAANLKLSYSDERVIHFGLIPRAHRSLFVINELPDLQARIQVTLFNILQEGDIQIRGFNLRLPLDIEFVFTANPEDYTNRGSIVTPLKDRIQSQIITHYPDSIDNSMRITQQEAKIGSALKERVSVPAVAERLIEQIAVTARTSEYIDPRSGVSARLTISAFEMLIAACERRMIINSEPTATVRVADFWAIVPAITGKVELVYEGEVEGPAGVAKILIGKAIRTMLASHFPDPEQLKKTKTNNPYKKTIDWFGKGNTIDIKANATHKEYEAALLKPEGLVQVIKNAYPSEPWNVQLFLAEFVLFALAEYSLISRNLIGNTLQFADILSGMFSMSGAMDGFEEDMLEDN